MTVEYYSNKQHLMQADSLEFVVLISNFLRKSVQNWYRTIFATECATLGVHKMRQRFLQNLRERTKPRDFEYNLRSRMFELRQHGSIIEYESQFQDLLFQAKFPITWTSVSISKTDCDVRHRRKSMNKVR